MHEQVETPRYKGYERRGLSETKQRHVNDHLTPLAAIIVIPGLFVAKLPMLETMLAGSLILVSVAINYLLMFLAKAEKARFFGSIRVTSNYIVNIVLLWMLYAAWPPVWLLLLLMSIGVAIYQPRKDSLRTSVAFSLMLIVVHMIFGEQSSTAWIEVGVMSWMIVLMNLYVNGLVRRPGLLPSDETDNEAQDANQVQAVDQVLGVNPVQGTN